MQKVVLKSVFGRLFSLKSKAIRVEFFSENLHLYGENYNPLISIVYSAGMKSILEELDNTFSPLYFTEPFAKYGFE